ncbi:Uncharacterised protein [Mycobacteroides abscessus subsp. abscessus]|uniref:hypothetical protein n=1 Tax=Mycobacteroides abscessus TaxID=36809 RepID=UPI0009A638D0|nr:hypothetical protein [Mycobacteroides abscessus]SLJ23276.1 Uncharacterised protein [Mycobacteroides abscessus subsp. abscessus]
MSDGRGLRSFRALLRRWVWEDTTPDPVAEAAPAEAADQGVEWSNFINRELDREYTRRDTVNTRAAAAATSATALITVTLAVLGIAKGAHYVIEGLELQALLATAILLLFVAVVLGISAGAVGGAFTVAAEADLRSMLSAQRWSSNNIDARYYTADLNIIAIKTLREGTSRKYHYLVTAHGVQAAGVFLLALFALKVIFG